MIIASFLGLVVGFIGLWLWMQKRIEATQNKLEHSFKACIFDLMNQNGKQFLNMADATLQPFKETMKSLDEHQRELEKRREGAYAALSKQIEGLILSEKELRMETTRLAQSLKAPQARGSWGEVHLRRVVELAGMLNHCDFFEQKTFETEKGISRPDLIIRLPGDRQIAVDAKAPLGAFLDATDAGDETLRKVKLQDHAAALRKRMKELSGKEYWKNFGLSPEYVILFLPAEAFFSAALQADPTLIEVAADQNIVVATPTTLIAILRAIAQGWRQESLSKSIKEIAKLGQELYDRIGTVCDHWNKVGKSLNSAVESYNQSIASLESRVLVSARKMKEIGAFSKDLPEIEKIEKSAIP